MAIHTCDICKREFKQKVHLTKHKARKNPCKKEERNDSIQLNNVIVTTKKTRNRSLKVKETKPMSWFSEHCPELYNCVTKQVHPAIQKGHKFIVFRAEVKTGKRFAVEIYALYTTPLDPTNIAPGERIVHVFISSWVRIADNNQREELQKYLRGSKHDTRVFKIKNEKSRIICIKKLQQLVDQNDMVIVHDDELDYGSGRDQHMAAVFDFCLSHEKIRLICYSASPEEAIMDRLTTTSYKLPLLINFIPPANYRGAKWFCDNNLVYDAKPFFNITESGEITVSDSTKELLQRAKNRILSNDPRENKKKLLIVRQINNFGSIYDLVNNDSFPELMSDSNIRILKHFVHSNSEYNDMNIRWDDYKWWKRQMEEEREGKFLLILFLDQSSTRSTDWFCHPWLTAYHDYHPEDTPINTSLQSNLRGVYFTNKFCDGKQVYNNEEFFPEIHGQKDVIQYAAGIIPITSVKRSVSTRGKVFEEIPTFGPVISIQLNQQEFEENKERLSESLTNTSKDYLKKLIISKLKPRDKREFDFENRQLHGKRRYYRCDESEAQGGIYTVAGNCLRKINSRPGGGNDVQDGSYDNRHQYFWIDVAMDNLQFSWESQAVIIPKGTIYVTYGLKDPEVDDDNESVSSESSNEDPNHQHRTKKTSMFVR